MQIEPGAESVLIAPVDLCGWLSKYVQLWDLELFTKILWAVKIVGPTASIAPTQTLSQSNFPKHKTNRAFSCHSQGPGDKKCPQTDVHVIIPKA